MSRLLLDGYRPRDKKWPVYVLDTETKQVEILWFANQAAGKEAGPKCGTADYRKIGGWISKREGFFALYVMDGVLHLWLDGRIIKINRNVQVKRGRDFLLRKHFRVLVEGQKVSESRYSYLDYEDFPDQDIFWGMTRNLADQEHRHRTLLIWEDKAKGVDQFNDSYFQSLNERVKSA